MGAAGTPSNIGENGQTSTHLQIRIIELVVCIQFHQEYPGIPNSAHVLLNSGHHSRPPFWRGGGTYTW